LAELTTNPSPPHQGKNAVQVKLSRDGKPVAGAKVTVQFFLPGMPQMGMAEMKSTAQLNDQGNGSYAGQVELGSGGTWQVTITAKQSGKLILAKRLNLSATGGM
jgi:Cu(I)/Ag(I) efflux system membrane fusion protein/cobalt-zinc-cadmium efflux system membrane fusion protein